MNESFKPESLYDDPEQIERYINFLKKYGVLGLTPEEHKVIGSSVPNTITNKSNVPLYESMSEDERIEYLTELESGLRTSHNQESELYQKMQHELEVTRKLFKEGIVESPSELE